MNLKILPVLLILLFSKGILKSEIRLPKLISDGMVLQRNADVKIWGWASPGESVSLVFLDQNSATEADASGHWEIQLSNLKAGGGFQMEHNRGEHDCFKRHLRRRCMDMFRAIKYGNDHETRKPSLP